MYLSHLSNYVIKESQTIAEAFWKLEKQKAFLNNVILAVLDKNDCYIGLIVQKEIRDIWHIDDPTTITAGEICNKNGRFCRDSPNSRVEAMAIFADNNHINAIPVIDESYNLSDIIFRQQVFYRDFYLGNFHYGDCKFELPRMHYARQIYEAAQLAKALGYDSFSVIEFGVAGGNGLVNCEFHIREISRLFNLKIELYGFDTGEGLPESSDSRDANHLWTTGFYRMNIEKLKKRLQFAQLVIGDLNQTAQEFICKGDFAPIGVMLVDVDYYSSTVPILDMLHSTANNFLPRVYMYFDDIVSYLEHSGEMLAIDEFNARCQDVKISQSINSFHASIDPELVPHLYCAHLFKHEKYNYNKRTSFKNGCKLV